MYRCKHCGMIFEEPEDAVFKFLDGNTVCYKICPFCKIKNIEKVPENE